MRKTNTRFFGILFALFGALNISYANQMTLTAPEVDCATLQGMWAGYVSNPEQLFYDGGPWTVSINFKVKDDRFVGQVKAGIEKPSRTPDNIKQTLSKTIMGQCQQGKLTKVFLGKAGDCGHFAEPSLLLNSKTLVLHLPYENAMKGTHFTAMLIKTDPQMSERVSKMKVTAHDKIETCH